MIIDCEEYTIRVYTLPDDGIVRFEAKDKWLMHEVFAADAILPCSLIERAVGKTYKKKCQEHLQEFKAWADRRWQAYKESERLIKSLSLEEGRA